MHTPFADDDSFSELGRVKAAKRSSVRADAQATISPASTSLVDLGTAQLLQARHELSQKIAALELEEPLKQSEVARAEEKNLQVAVEAAHARVKAAHAELVNTIMNRETGKDTKKLFGLIKRAPKAKPDALGQAQQQELIDALQVQEDRAEAEWHDLQQQLREASRQAAHWKTKVTELEFLRDRLDALHEEILEPQLSGDCSLDAEQQLQEDIKATNERIAQLKDHQARCVKGIMLQKLTDKDIRFSIDALQLKAWHNYVLAIHDACIRVEDVLDELESLLPEDLVRQADEACTVLALAAEAVQPGGSAEGARKKRSVGLHALETLSSAVQAIESFLQDFLQNKVNPGIAFAMRERDKLQMKLCALHAYLVESMLMTKSTSMLRRHFLVGLGLDEIIPPPPPPEAPVLSERPYAPLFSIRRGANHVRTLDLSKLPAIPSAPSSSLDSESIFVGPGASSSSSPFSSAPPTPTPNSEIRSLDSTISTSSLMSPARPHSTSNGPRSLSDCGNSGTTPSPSTSCSQGSVSVLPQPSGMLPAHRAGSVASSSTSSSNKAGKRRVNFADAQVTVAG